MASEAQRKAVKKYLSDKKRVYVTFDQEELERINIAKDKLNPDVSMAKFIKEVCLYYVDFLEKK